MNRPLAVCTAHIHWDPELCDVKLVQTMMLVQELDKVLKKLETTYNIPYDHLPTLICGDLNSLPESGVCEFLSTGMINSHHPELKDFRGQSCLKGLSSGGPVDVCTHPLQLQSAYEPVDIPFTNYTGDFKGVIDYVYFSPASLLRLGVLGPLQPEWFLENKIVGCPHPSIPSDRKSTLITFTLADFLEIYG
ncbi:unnamed protein product [Soboliphyme baturini]|uniref:Endo/exonuclease/phosphatase domain-containing protein n=1 Tax=Soboliphyme baturini TaxID=241478 RepID=A0A183IK64_9BILA|nr:unnamed protein product [Soboliphyme baturini]